MWDIGHFVYFVPSVCADSDAVSAQSRCVGPSRRVSVSFICLDSKCFVVRRLKRVKIKHVGGAADVLPAFLSSEQPAGRDGDSEDVRQRAADGGGGRHPGGVREDRDPVPGPHRPAAATAGQPEVRGGPVDPDSRPSADVLLDQNVS